MHPAPVASAAPVAKTATSSAPAHAVTTAPVAAVVNLGRVKISPLAKKVAASKGVDVTRVAGTGPGGRIVRRDVEGAPSGGGTVSAGIFGGKPIAQDGVRPVSQMRAAIARRLVESKTTAPHFYVEREVDAAPLAKLRGFGECRAGNGGGEAEAERERFRFEGGGGGPAAGSRGQLHRGKGLPSGNMGRCIWPLRWLCLMG